MKLLVTVSENSSCFYWKNQWNTTELEWYFDVSKRQCPITEKAFLCHTIYMALCKLPDFVIEIDPCHSDSWDRFLSFISVKHWIFSHILWLIINSFIFSSGIFDSRESKWQGCIWRIRMRRFYLGMVVHAPYIAKKESLTQLSLVKSSFC